MSKVVTSLAELEAQLRKDGYKGTHRAMRLIKTLRSSLEASGYSFAVTAASPVKARSRDKGSEETFSEALDNLV